MVPKKNLNTKRSERRKHPRLENNIPLKITSEEGDCVTESWNLSRTGVYCRLDKHLRLMTKLKIHLLLSIRKNDKLTTKKISCQGVVVRIESIAGTKDFNTAIYFNEIQQKDAEYVSDYVSEALEKKQAV